MSVLVVSVSHKTTELDVLARLALDADATAKLAVALTESEHVDEAVVLSTCNRTEVYASVARFHAALDDVIGQLADFAGLAVAELGRICAVFFDEGAVAHAFAVASGLESVVVGENQVLGQFRAALGVAQHAGTVGTVLNALFQQGIRVGKRVHAETAVGGAGRSLVSAAFALLTAQIGPLSGRRVLVVGAGSMASLASRSAAAAGGVVAVVNRTPARARRLADAVHGEARPWSELPDAVRDTDVVVTCTGARDLLLRPDDLRDGTVIGVVDLALPADVAPEVASLPLTLVNLETLVSIDADPAARNELDAARTLVQGEVRDFLGVRRAASVAPTVVALRSMASEVVVAELARLDSRLPDLSDRQRAELHGTVSRVVEKLLHRPTVRVQELAADPDALDYAAALRDLFALDPSAVAAVMSATVTP